MRSQLTKVLQEQEENEEINMTPMLDVVFILLIFFIVTASFVKEAGIEVNRPEAATALKKERANILVAISDKGEVWINKRRVDIRAVQANIERLKAENPQGTVVIQADKKATTEVLIKVMDSARAAGVFDVSIAAQEA
ncbi:ExbD/TolR family protein [Thalassotalea mangrovi]|uniref:Biopolymer transporter ExbD n=1 Tax=Thalassotalea mangrovi TaxID=2572245 RepID=A0A4U1B3D7_9GAMM|nr:biopolymer transporter ExbD [Thalassotalea mangrovi]TKB44478.1 biopolymer transporter ExbD [Thalassotalea mangrovi]